MEEITRFINQHMTLSIMWISLLTMVLIITLSRLSSKVKIITYREAISLINRENAIIIDLRQCSDFHKGHIAGSINLIETDIENNNITILAYSKDKPIIIVDDMGFLIKKNIVKILNRHGFERVFILEKGISGWISENLPLIRSISEKKDI